MQIFLKRYLLLECLWYNNVHLEIIIIIINFDSCQFTIKKKK